MAKHKKDIMRGLRYTEERNRLSITHRIFRKGFETDGVEIRRSEVDQVRAYTHANWKPVLHYTHLSYGAKYVAEQALGIYVSNGTMITALLREGYECIVDPPNGFFNIGYGRRGRYWCGRH